jgi:hypothetical protein
VILDARKEIDERLIEEWKGIRRPVLERTQVDQEPDRRLIRPVVRSSQYLALQDP